VTNRTIFEVLNTAGGPQVNLRTEPPAEKPLIVGTIFTERLRSSAAELAGRFSELLREGSEQPVIKAMQLLEPRLQDATVLSDGVSAEINLRIGSKPQRFVPLSLAGDGITRIAEYLLAIAAMPDGLVLLDEVASDFHYSRLKDIWSAIDTLSQEVQTQVIVTTHSRECIAAAEEAFRDDPSALALYRIVRGKTGEPGGDVVRYDAESLGGAIELGLDVR
jgi:predicted ATPase